QNILLTNFITRSFKDQFVLPVNSYLIQIRVTHAKQLLRFTDLSVEKTGQECGMNDANYFSRILRKQKGLHRGSIGECEIWSDCKSI
ncbi:MAG: helix-turn-helix domain-containing protein, partial [Anaerobutyricum sp.]